MSDSLRPYEPQHARPPCPLPTAGVHPNPCSLSQWCHPTISSSVVPFSSCPQSFPASGSFSNESDLHIRWPKDWSSASVSVLPMNTQDWSPLSPRDSQESSPTQFKSINSLVLSFLYSPTLTSIHDCWKTIPFTRQTFVGKVTSLLFNMLSRLVITFQEVSIF